MENFHTRPNEFLPGSVKPKPSRRRLSDAKYAEILKYLWLAVNTAKIPHCGPCDRCLGTMRSAYRDARRIYDQALNAA